MTREAKRCGERVRLALSGGGEEAVVDGGNWNGDSGRDRRRIVNCDERRGRGCGGKDISFEGEEMKGRRRGEGGKQKGSEGAV